MKEPNIYSGGIDVFSSGPVESLGAVEGEVPLSPSEDLKKKPLEANDLKQPGRLNVFVLVGLDLESVLEKIMKL